MKLNFYPETDSLYIQFSNRPSVDTKVITEGLNIDLDSDEKVVGIDIDNTTNMLELDKLEVSQLPVKKKSG